MSSTSFTVYKASAGSGKTYTITERIEKLIADGQVRPSELIATTFTEKAAGELTGRIRTRLLEEGHLGSARELPSALIGTVNAVTGKILTTYAVDAGMDPELNVLDESAAAHAFTIATEKYLYETEYQENNKALLERLGYNTENIGGKTTLAKTVARMVGLARSNDIEIDQLKGFARTSKEALKQAMGPVAEMSSSEAYCTEAEAYYKNLLAIFAEDEKATTRLNEAEKNLNKDFSAWQELSWNSRAKLLSNPFGTYIKYRNRAKALADYLEPQENAGLVPEPSVTLLADKDYRKDLLDLIDLVFEATGTCMGLYADYKRALGYIDFIDQEHLSLQLLRTSNQVREAISGQYKLLVVDEFQDTSPIQLAVFMELAQLVEDVIWVGDPKQSIYRFRGSDPQLMAQALAQLEQTGNSSIQTLPNSYRTSQIPLDFSNAIFSKIFTAYGVPEEEITLSITQEQLDQGKQIGGSVEIWRLGSEPSEEELSAELALDEGEQASADGVDEREDIFDALAAGIADDMRQETDPTAIPSRAVLVRTNDDVEKAINSLSALGVPCIGDFYGITGTREMQLIQSAIAFALDTRNTQALMEITRWMPEHPAYADWLDTLTSLKTMAERAKLLKEWAAHSSLDRLRDLASQTGTLSIPDFVRATIEAIDLPGRIATWSQPDIRVSHLDGAVQAAYLYLEEAKADGAIPTLQGFVDYLGPFGGNPTTSAPSQPGAVVVSTIHGAKGLEWDEVYLALKDHAPGGKFKPNGSWVQSETTMNLANPLAGRALYFWPDTLSANAEISARLMHDSLQINRWKAEVEEEQRLYYVALTRSKTRTVCLFANEFLNAFSEFKGLLQVGLPDTGGPGEITMSVPPTPEQLEEYWDSLFENFEQWDYDAEDDREETDDSEQIASDADTEVPVDRIPALFRWVSGFTGEPLEPHSARLAALARPESVDGEEKPFVPARFVASQVEATDEEKAAAVIYRVATIGERLVERGGMKWNQVGDAVHAYLALPLAQMDVEARANAASSLVDRWGVGAYLEATHLTVAGEQWLDWINRAYPGAAVRTEVPFTWTNELGQSTSGWMDTLIETTDGDLIVVDHKTYPGEDPSDHLRKHYVGQMTVYSHAIENITGRKPSQVIMHLPLIGEIWAMEVN